MDIKDRYKKSIQNDLFPFSKTCPDTSFQRKVPSDIEAGIGKPTTCAYQFINMTDPVIDGSLYQFLFASMDWKLL